MQVVLIEGLPGSGKSTTSHLTARLLARGGRQVRWIYEHDQPHPILPYGELMQAMQEARTMPGVFEEVPNNWEQLLQGPEDALVLDGAFLQMPLHSLVLNDWEPQRIEAFVASVEQRLMKAQTLLVLLRQADAASAITEACDVRGTWFADFLIRQATISARGQRLGWSGWSGVLAHFKAYEDLIDRLRTQLRIPLLELDADGERHLYVPRIAQALGLPGPDPAPAGPELPQCCTGRFMPQGADAADPQVPHLEILIEDGQLMVGSDAGPSRLFHLGDHRFEILGTPVRLDFTEAGPEGRFDAIECHTSLPMPARWRRTA